MTIDMLRDALQELEQMLPNGKQLHKELTDAAAALVALAAKNFVSKTKPLTPLDSAEATRFSQALVNAVSLQLKLQELLKGSVGAAFDIMRVMYNL